MSKILKLIFIFALITITSCSYHKNSKFWNKEKITLEKTDDANELFKKKETTFLELNPNLEINLIAKEINNSFLNNLNNNNGRINYKGKLKNSLKYKFSKIKNFDQYEPELLFNKDNVIFFDNKGSILNFDDNSNLLWKKNYYSKIEQKQKPILFFANNDRSLIVTDNIAKFYALDIYTGELLWSKKHVAPFNSQIKIYKDNFFVIDFENILRSYSLVDGKEIWNIKTEKSLVRSQKKLSMVIVNEKIYFNNSLGHISAVDINSGELIWQIPTQSSIIYDESFFLKTSDLIANNDTLYFSNNKNQFFSVDLQTGIVNWTQKISSSLRPTLIDDYLFTVSTNGYLIIIEKKTGNIIRINNIFNSIKNHKKKNVNPTGFVVGKDSIYITTSHGRILEIDILSGKTISIIKVNNKKISRPAIISQDFFITTDSSIIKLN